MTDRAAILTGIEHFKDEIKWFRHRSNMEPSSITPIHVPKRTGHISAMTPYQVECAQRRAMARNDAPQELQQPALGLKPSYQPLVDEMQARMKRMFGRAE